MSGQNEADQLDDRAVHRDGNVDISKTTPAQCKQTTKDDEQNEGEVENQYEVGESAKYHVVVVQAFSLALHPVIIHHLTHDSPYSEPGHKPSRAHHAAKPAASRSASGRRRRKAPAAKSGKSHKSPKPHRPHKARSELTSHPTTRNAFVATREWLLGLHGPVCAYCGTKHSARTMTLDHVAPRRGQTAYDRRDNLVLACKTCNQKKKDLAPLAFLLGLKSRAANLLKYGAHLSTGLLDLARALVPEKDREDDDSPYRD